MKCVSTTMHLASWALNAVVLASFEVDDASGDVSAPDGNPFLGMANVRVCEAMYRAVSGELKESRSKKTTVPGAEDRLKRLMRNALHSIPGMRELCESPMLSRAHRGQMFNAAGRSYKTSMMEHFRRTIPRVASGYVKWHVAALADREPNAAIRAAWWKSLRSLHNVVNGACSIASVCWTHDVQVKGKDGKKREKVHVDLKAQRSDKVDGLCAEIAKLVSRCPATTSWTADLLKQQFYTIYRALVVERRGAIPHVAVKEAVADVAKNITKIVARKITVGDIQWVYRKMCVVQEKGCRKRKKFNVDVAALFPEVKDLFKCVVGGSAPVPLPLHKPSNATLRNHWAEYLPFLRWMQFQADRCCAQHSDGDCGVEKDVEGDALASHTEADTVMEEARNEQKLVPGRRRKAPLKSFTVFPMIQMGRRFVSYDKCDVVAMRVVLGQGRSRGQKRKRGEMDTVAPEHVGDDDVMMRVFNHPSIRGHVKPPDPRMGLRSVQTDGATLILRFTLRKSDLGDKPVSGPVAFNGSVFHHSLTEATKKIKETPIPKTVTNITQIGGVTSLEHLRDALDRIRAGGVGQRIRVVGTDPGRESLVYCAGIDLGHAAEYRWSGDDKQHVRESAAKALEEMGARYRMTSKRHLWLSGKMKHRRAELRWRHKSGVETAWQAMNDAGTWKTASLESFTARLACQTTPHHWKKVLEYTFGCGFWLARMARRLRFCMQRHNAVTANVMAGLRRVKKRKKRKWKVRKKRRRGRGRARRRYRGRKPWVSKRNRPVLTVIAMGNGVFSACSRGYAPSSHRPYVKELASRPGVVVAMVDEFRTSKCCFRCGSEMVKGKAGEDGRGSRVVKCAQCIQNMTASGSPLVTATRNRDLNGAANMALLACRAFTFGTGEETRPGPWKRGTQIDASPVAARMSVSVC